MSTRRKLDPNKFQPVKELPESARSLRNSILSLKPRRKEIVELPNGLKIEVRELSVGQRNRISSDGYDWTGGEDGDPEVRTTNAAFVPLTLIFACHDPESGEPLFTLADVGAINDMSEDDVAPLFHAALRVSALHSGAEAEEKNASEASDDSSSTSPEN